jgi:hypothetical protein
MTDYAQTENLAGADPREAHYIDLLTQTMRAMDAPPEQYERLGLQDNP